VAENHTQVLRCFTGSLADEFTTNSSKPGNREGRETRGVGSHAATVLPLLVGVHIASLGNLSVAKRLITGVWRTVCTACGIRCASPPLVRATEGVAPVTLPADIELAVVTLHHHQVPDLDATTGETPAFTIASQWQPAAVGRFVHFILDLGRAFAVGQDLSPGYDAGSSLTASSPGEASERTESATESPLSALPGIAGTRMIMRVHERATLPVPPIQHLCQNRTMWRNVFRFIGVRNGILSELWRRLGHDWPSLFRCDNSTLRKKRSAL
jgi:hypothetical protein